MSSTNQNNLHKVELDFHGKEIEWKMEAVNRLCMRGILDVYGYDLAKCKADIERMLKKESIIVTNPDPNYMNQKWCLIDIPKIGLTKIPIAETPVRIVIITVATPVTDPRCIKAFFGE